MKRTTGWQSLMVGVLIGAASASAAEPPDAVELSARGEALMTTYAGILSGLRTELATAIPDVDETQAAAFMAAYADVGKARGDAWGNKAEFAATLGPVATAQSNALIIAEPILADLDGFLSSDTLDAKLVRCALLTEATPAGLAAFAQQGKAEAKLVEELLADPGLMKQMLEAGGARCGKYGEAMQIYDGILKASKLAREPGILQRFALGTSLELAVPLKERSHTNMADKETRYIDPVKRYLHYEKAFLDGELDPLFKTLTAWECRFIPTCEAPDEELAWGRKMLQIYRPDHIFTDDYKWRYSKIVKTDVKYGGKNPSIPELGFFQDILNTGGVCGKRAFFGRFMLRAFGIPTFGMRQRGHAALGHWTPEGWTMNFGAHWTWGWWDRPGHSRSGMDFLLETQARDYPADYLKVLRAEWVGDALGEQKRERRTLGSGDLWNALSLYQKRAIVAEAKPVEVALAGEDLAEANESTKAEEIMQAEVAEADRQIVVDQAGIIRIPAVACTIPTSNTVKIAFMKSFSGGMQLHYNRLGNDAEVFAYSIDAPDSGDYLLVADVATVNTDLHVLLTINDAKTVIDVALPYTIGLWGRTEPVKISLRKGANTLRFTREAPNYGATIKVFTLTPVK